MWEGDLLWKYDGMWLYISVWVGRLEDGGFHLPRFDMTEFMIPENKDFDDQNAFSLICSRRLVRSAQVKLLGFSMRL